MFISDYRQGFSNGVGYPNGGIIWRVVPIPTLSQWGLFTFTLLLLSMGIVFVYKRQNALAVAGYETQDLKPSLFDRSLYFKALGSVLFIAIAGLVVAYRYYGTLSITDTLGTLASTCIVAYMVQLSILIKKK